MCYLSLQTSKSEYVLFVPAGGDCFTESDEASLKMFGVFCSLAVSFGTLHERRQKKVR